MNVHLPRATQDRLGRIQQLRKFNVDEALEYAITCGWLAAEKMEERRVAKDSSGGKGGGGKDDKAPTTGSNTKNDNKATDTGKPYPPNRPKAN